jgi:hypothetical protein
MSHEFAGQLSRWAADTQDVRRRMAEHAVWLRTFKTRMTTAAAASAQASADSNTPAQLPPRFVAWDPHPGAAAASGSYTAMGSRASHGAEMESHGDNRGRAAAGSDRRRVSTRTPPRGSAGRPGLPAPATSSVVAGLVSPRVERYRRSSPLSEEAALGLSSFAAEV